MKKILYLIFASMLGLAITDNLLAEETMEEESEESTQESNESMQGESTEQMEESSSEEMQEE